MAPSAKDLGPRSNRVKLYILRPVKDAKEWDPWYDKAFGFVVSASSVKQARMLAADRCGDEGKAAWLSSRQH